MAETRREYWSRLIAEQEVSGKRVRPFCRERGIGEHSFYWWRKRLGERRGVRFALLETTAASGSAGATWALELALPRGEQLRIGNGVDAATLRLVLETVRG